MLQNRKVQIVFACLIIAITHSEQRHQNQGQGRRNNQALQTRQLEQRKMQERDHRAREMLKFMNTEADVCKDFYNYACGNWLQYQNTDMANDGELLTVQSEMEKFVNKQLQIILNAPVSAYDTQESKVAKDFYKSCLRVPASSPAQRQFMQNFVLSHGGLADVKGTQWKPNYDWIHIIADLRRNYGFDILIGLQVDKTNPNHKAIIIEEPQTTLLPVELCSTLAARQIDENDQAFEKIQEEIKGNLQNWFELSDPNALRIAGDVIRFEFDLCKYMRQDQMLSTPLDNEEEEETANSRRRGNSGRMVENKIHGVRQNTANSLQNLRSLSENYRINFKEFVDHSLDTRTVSQVYFRSDDYFKQLSTIAEKGLQASFANYIMYRALSEINFPLNQRSNQRPFYCTNQVMRYLPPVLGKLYNDKINSEEAKKDMLEVFFNIKEAFAKYLQADVNWMSDNTKRSIKQKLNTLKIFNPTYPQSEDKIRGYPFHDTHWHKLESIMMYNANQTILQVSSSNEHFNIIEAPAVAIQQRSLSYELVVGVGLFQKPFYSEFYANSLKYSSLGVAIAREIIKLFDYQGSQQNPMNTFPWDDSTVANFSLINECFRTQMSNHFHNNPNVFRNATKLNEVVTETRAISVAFSAYLKWLENPSTQRADLRLETLPDMNFTNTQLFFINFAQTRCAARNNEDLPPEFLPLHRRTWEQYHINGPLSNNVEFGRDFNCNVGSDMNLDDKCFTY